MAVYWIPDNILRTSGSITSEVKNFAFRNAVAGFGSRNKEDRLKECYFLYGARGREQKIS